MVWDIWQWHRIITISPNYLRKYCFPPTIRWLWICLGSSQLKSCWPFWLSTYLNLTWKTTLCWYINNMPKCFSTCIWNSSAPYINSGHIHATCTCVNVNCTTLNNTQKVRASPCVIHNATCNQAPYQEVLQNKMCDTLCCRCHKAALGQNFFLNHKSDNEQYLFSNIFLDKSRDQQLVLSSATTD